MTKASRKCSLQGRNMEVINNLSTSMVEDPEDNMWVICGATVDCHRTYRIVNNAPVLMCSWLPKGRPFYRIELLGPVNMFVRTNKRHGAAR